MCEEHVQGRTRQCSGWDWTRDLQSNALTTTPPSHTGMVDSGRCSSSEFGNVHVFEHSSDVVTVQCIIRYERCAGMCSPRFLRSTMYNIPCTHDLLKQTHVPFALVLSPFSTQADDEVYSFGWSQSRYSQVSRAGCKTLKVPWIENEKKHLKSWSQSDTWRKQITSWWQLLWCLLLVELTTFRIWYLDIFYASLNSSHSWYIAYHDP